MLATLCPQCDASRPCGCWQCCRSPHKEHAFGLMKSSSSPSCAQPIKTAQDLKAACWVCPAAGCRVLRFGLSLPLCTLRGHRDLCDLWARPPAPSPTKGSGSNPALPNLRLCSTNSRVACQVHSWTSQTAHAKPQVFYETFPVMKTFLWGFFFFFSFPSSSPLLLLLVEWCFPKTKGLV